MWELDYKGSRVLNNLRFWTESPLDSKEIPPVHEAETPILWPPDAKNWLIVAWPSCWERLKARGEGETEDELLGWHHRLSRHESEQALGVGDGQGSMMRCSPWGRKASEMNEQLNWAELSMALPTRPRPSFTHSQSLPSGSFHKSLIFIHQRADRMKTTITKN